MDIPQVFSKNIFMYIDIFKKAIDTTRTTLWNLFTFVNELSFTSSNLLYNDITNSSKICPTIMMPNDIVKLKIENELLKRIRHPPGIPSMSSFWYKLNVLHHCDHMLVLAFLTIELTLCINAPIMLRFVTVFRTDHLPSSFV